MGSEERLSTREIASPGESTDPRFERDADAPPADTADAPPADTADAPPADTAEAPSERESGGAVRADRETGDGDAAPADRETGDADADAGRPSPEAATPAVPAPEREDTGDAPADAAPLLADSEGFQSRWEEIQVRFVDEPRGAVEDADALVASVMKRLAEGFAQERERLEAQWGRGEDISTEDLRVALQRYRSFFQRLLST
jgi:hypothetical protein